MFTGLLTLILIAAFCLAVGGLLGCDAGLLPLPALCGGVVLLYAAGLLGVLRLGYYAVLAALLAGTVCGAVRAGAAALRKAACSPGFLLFVGGGVFFWLLFAALGPMFTQWDEFTAWGLAPKMVVERAAFYVADPINLTASHTYPGTSLVAYLFQAAHTDFSEWQCLASLDILLLACLTPAAALPRAKWPSGVLAFGAGALLPFFFSTVPAGAASTVYANAMADTPLALLFGGTLCLYYAAGSRRGGFAACALPLALLAMVKDMGFAYGLMAAFLIGVDRLFAAPRPAGWGRGKAFGAALAQGAALALPVAAVFLSWNRYTALADPGGGAATVGSAGLGYGAVLTGGVKQLLGIGRTAGFAAIMEGMAAAFTTRSVSLLGAPARVVGLIAALALAAFLAAPKGAMRRRVAVAFLGAAFCFAALYLFHLILYYYNFSEAEGQALKDYERYIAPYLQGWLLFTLFQLAQSGAAGSALPQRAGGAALGLCTVGLYALFGWRGVPVAGFWSSDSSLYTVRADVKARAAAMNEALSWSDRVLVISQGDDATRWYYYKYELTAKVVNGYGGVWFGDGDYSSRWDSDFMNLVESLNWTLYENEAVCNEASLVAYMDEKNCDYLVLDRADDYLAREFSGRFEGGITADQGATLYKFMGPDAEIAFVPVAVAESGVTG